MARARVRALDLLALAAAGALAALPLAAAARPEIPPLTGPVVDRAGLLPADAERRLEALARAARGAAGTGVQLQYLIVPSLEGEPIEEFSIRVAEAWKLGTREADNGVLVTVAVQDRAVRIEVGGGLEGGLTDVQSSRIIRGTIAPAFQAGRHGDGLHDAGVQILGALGALPAGIEPTQRRVQPGSRFSALGLLGIFMAVFVFRVLTGFGPRRRRALWWGGPFIGGGGGGFGGFGGGGGGSWSGGGGGFSGGGASGRW